MNPNPNSGSAAKTYTAVLPISGESLRILVHGGPDVPDLDTEAEHVAEAIAALKDAKFHFEQIKGTTNRVAVSMHLPRIEAQLDRERRAVAHEHFKSERRIAAYRAEAIGDALFNALGIKNTTIAYRLRELEDHIQREDAEAQRKAQRERERAIFDAATLAVERRSVAAKKERRGHVAKVSDASLLVEVRSRRHRSISEVARAVGLAVPTTWNRLNALVKAGKLGADEVPKSQNGGGRPRRQAATAGKVT